MSALKKKKPVEENRALSESPKERRSWFQAEVSFTGFLSLLMVLSWIVLSVIDRDDTTFPQYQANAQVGSDAPPQEQ